MNISFFYVIHVFSAILLVAINFYAFASPRPEIRKKILKYSGISSLVVFLSGFGLHGMLHLEFQGWFITKIISWLFLSALAGMAFRLSSKISLLMKLNAFFVLLALVMVYFKPF